MLLTPPGLTIGPPGPGEDPLSEVLDVGGRVQPLSVLQEHEVTLLAITVHHSKHLEVGKMPFFAIVDDMVEATTRGLGELEPSLIGHHLAEREGCLVREEDGNVSWLFLELVEKKFGPVKSLLTVHMGFKACLGILL